MSCGEQCENCAVLKTSRPGAGRSTPAGKHFINDLGTQARVSPNAMVIKPEKWKSDRNLQVMRYLRDGQ